MKHYQSLKGVKVQTEFITKQNSKERFEGRNDYSPQDITQNMKKSGSEVAFRKKKERKNEKVLFSIGKRSPFLVRNQKIQEMIKEQTESKENEYQTSTYELLNTQRKIKDAISRRYQQCNTQLQEGGKRFQKQSIIKNVVNGKFDIFEEEDINLGKTKLNDYQGALDSKRQSIIKSVELSQESKEQKLNLKKNLHKVLHNCFKLERSSKKDQSAINSSFERMNNFYSEYQRFVDFKQESGWYENQNITQEILKNPKFKLPEIGRNSQLMRKSSRKYNEITQMVTQQKELEYEMEAENKGSDKGKIYLLRSDLTTAENFFNIQRMKNLAINHNSIHNLNTQAVKEFQNSQSDRKIISYTKVKYLHNKRQKKKNDQNQL